MSVECQIKQLSLFIQLEIRWGVQNCIFICEQCERGNQNECMKGQSIVYSIVIIIMAWLNQMKKSLRECSLLQHLAWTQRDFQAAYRQYSIVQQQQVTYWKLITLTLLQSRAAHISISEAPAIACPHLWSTVCNMFILGSEAIHIEVLIYPTHARHYNPWLLYIKSNF